LQRWFTEALASGLLGDAEDGCDLRPGSAISARLRYLLCKSKIAGGYGSQGFADGL